MLGPLSGVQSMSWTETPAEAFRRRCEEKLSHDRVMDILNRMIIEIDEALIKAKAQMEYLDDREIDLMKLGFDEDDIISGDLLGDEK